MKFLSRLTTLLVVFPVTYYISYLLTAGVLSAFVGDNIDPDLQHWIHVGLSPLAAGLATWITWIKLPASIPQVLGMYILLAGLLTGGVGFIAGVFWPMFAGNESPSASLMGVLITGPLGFILGTIVGGIVWGVQRQSLAE